MPAAQTLGLAGHLLGINRVGVHSGRGRSLGIAGNLDRFLLLAQLGLQLLPRSGIGGGRPESPERRLLLLHLQGRLVPQRAGVGIALAGQQRADLDLEGGEVLATLLLIDQQQLRGGDVRDAQLAQDVLHPRLGDAQSFLGPHPGLTPQGSLAVAGHVGPPRVHRLEPPLPDQVEKSRHDDHERQADKEGGRGPGHERHGNRRHGHDDDEAGGQDPGQATRHRLIRLHLRARFLAHGLLQDLDPALQGPHPVQGVAQVGDGSLRHRLQRHQSGLRLGRLTVALPALHDGGQFGAQSIGLADLLQQIAILGETLLGQLPGGARLGERLAVTFQLDQRRFSGLQCRLRASDRFLGSLEPAGVLVAARLERLDGLLQARLGT